MARTEVGFDKRQYHQQDEMIKWCRENIGPGGWEHTIDDVEGVWCVYSMFGNTWFKFREDKHAMLFKLKWA
jgi:hypothetical protein